MRDDDDVLKATLDGLLDNFRSALIAMRPFAAKAMINYEDQDTHRSWEQLAECMFDVFVRSPIDADRGRSGKDLPLVRYDIDQDDYLGSSWIALWSDPTARTAFVWLISRVEPLDTVQLAALDPVTLRSGHGREVPWREASFVFIRRAEDGQGEAVRQIEAVE